MPTFLAPYKSGAHRIAAIALYRALLSQSKNLPFLPEETSRVREVIRAKFKQQRYNTSTRQLKVLFTAGYEGVDLLDGAVHGDGALGERVKDLVGRARIPDTVYPWRRKSKVPTVKAQDNGDEKREKLDIFARPLPKELLKGKRRVPVLVNANHIPMLRFTKPQPEALSKYLHSRIMKRQRRNDQKQALEEAVRVAEGEDVWDEILASSGYGDGDGGVDGGDGSWTVEIEAALEEVLGKLEADKERNRAMAERMQGVVDREREVMEREEQEERRVKESVEEG